MRILTLYIFIIISGFINQSFCQTQIGQDLNGIGSLSGFGKAVTLDSIGYRVAIGAPGNSSMGQYSGQVKVFDLVDSEWLQIGQDLNGLTANENFGRTLAMSADGEILVVRISQENVAGAGYVQVYQLVDTVWQQMGSDLIGASQFGHQIDINASGARIIIGSNGNYAQVFEWNPDLSDWEQLGSTLLGSEACSPPEYFGRQVAIDGTGNRIVIGANNYDIGCSPTSDAGRAAVFEWDGNDWQQLGQSLYGINLYGFGGSVDISGNGERIACGAAYTFGPGHVFTYQFEQNDSTWMQYGDTIIGESVNNLGRDVNLSYNGCFISIGDPETDQLSGRVKRYRLSNGSWTIDGQDILGAASFQTGAAENGTVNMSSDGSKLCLGSPNINGGTCRVYSYPQTIDTALTVLACSNYSLNGYTYDASGVYIQSIASFSGCDSIIELDLTISELDSTVILNGGELVAVQDSVEYQWIDCDTEMDIPGETSQEFTPTEIGNYAVILSDGICDPTSECVSIQTVSLSENERTRLRIYPNPASDRVYFGKIISGELTIWTSDGRIVKDETLVQSESISISELHKGVYYLNVLMEDKILSSSFVVE